MAQPQTSDDTVLYSPHNIHADKDITLNLLDDSELNLWGDVKVNGEPIISGTLPTATAPEAIARVLNNVVITPLSLGQAIDGIPLVEFSDLPVKFISPGDSIASINSTINALSLAGGGIVYAKPGIHAITAEIILKDNISLVCDSAAFFELDTLTNAITATGAEGVQTAFTVNQTAGSFSVTLPAGQGVNFAVDDMIELRSNAIVIPSCRAREMHQVLTVVGDVLTLDRPLYWSYLTADTATFYKITPMKNVKVDVNLRWKIGGLKGRGVVFVNVLGGEINIKAINGPGATVTDSTGVTVKADINGAKEYATALGYGVTVAGCSTGIKVKGRFRACRHGVTTLPLEISPDTWTGPFFTQFDITGNNGTEGFAVGDTHAGAVETDFISPACVGPGQVSTPVIQDRGYKTRVIDPSLSGSHHGVSFVVPSFKGSVEGGKISILPSSGGACVVVAGDEVKIKNVDLEAASGYGVDTVGLETLIDHNTFKSFVGIRENAGVDKKVLVKDNTVYLQNAPGYAFFQSWGRYVNNTIVEDGTSTAVFQTPNASVTLEEVWQAPFVMPFEAAFAPKPYLHNCIKMTLTANVTINNPAVKISGGRLRIILVQDATGGRTTTLGSDFKHVFAPVTTANRINSIDFECDGTSWIQTAMAVGM